MIALILVVSISARSSGQPVRHLQEHRHAGKILLRELLLRDRAADGVFQDLDQLEELERVDFRGQLLARENGFTVKPIIANDVQDSFAKLALIHAVYPLQSANGKAHAHLWFPRRRIISSCRKPSHAKHNL